MVDRYRVYMQYILCIDVEETQAKKCLLKIIQDQWQGQPVHGDLQSERDATLASLTWEDGKCQGLQAGNLLQPIADYCNRSFNLYTINLCENRVLREQFTSLQPGGVSSKWLNIVCIPGNAQLLGNKNYDLHYIPASSIPASMAGMSILYL